MSYVVISSFENVETGDLQAQGEAIAVFNSEAPGHAHFAARSAVIEAAVLAARATDATAVFVTWVVMLRMPLEVADVEEALEDLELVMQETASPDDPFGELIVAYAGRRHAPGAVTEHSQTNAMQQLEVWLT